jgi:hypothetical protein
VAAAAAKRTTAWQVWGWLLQPGDTITLVNAAISGYLTTMLQRVIAQTLQRHRPGWVALFAGANDLLRYGTGATKPLVTGTETAQPGPYRSTTAPSDHRQPTHRVPDCQRHSPSLGERQVVGPGPVHRPDHLGEPAVRRPR